MPAVLGPPIFLGGREACPPSPPNSVSLAIGSLKKTVPSAAKGPELSEPSAAAKAATSRCRLSAPVPDAGRRFGKAFLLGSLRKNTKPSNKLGARNEPEACIGGRLEFWLT